MMKHSSGQIDPRTLMLYVTGGLVMRFQSALTRAGPGVSEAFDCFLFFIL